MFPDAQHKPTRALEESGDLFVALHIRAQLSLPELAMLWCRLAVLWAPVPKAPVQEHDYTTAWKDEIGAPVERVPTTPAFDMGSSE
jgi:hypothetical protein